MRYSPLAAVLLPSLLAGPARAHPAGLPPLAEIVPAGTAARTSLTLALDDTILMLIQAGAAQTDPGRLGPDALATQPGVEAYVDAHYGLSVPEGPCSASMAGAKDLGYGFRFLIDHRCPAPIGSRLAVRSDLLRDISPDYRTVVAVAVAGRRIRETIEPGETEATLDLDAAPAAGPGTSAAPDEKPSARARGLASLFSFLDAGRGASAAALALAIAAALGALHGLGPGHGKTLVAAYLTGSDARVRHAFGVGITLAVTHTAAVIAFGFAALAMGNKLVPARVEPVLSAAAAGIVVALGVWLFVTRTLALRRGAPPAQAHDTGAHTHRPVRGRGLLAIGFAGGIVPCPEAFGLLFVALTIGRVAAGLLLLIAFSAGLAAVLVGVSIVLVVGRTAVAPRLERARYVRFLPVVSAGLVTMIGVALAVGAARRF